ncbi:MAG: tRNA uridine-5-carboxymethylaminomethyl(34) synthesis GTPase MnmE [Myxococcota bacterium]
MIIGRRDTIAAIATPSGPGGVGIVRISGPAAAAIAARMIGRAQDRVPDRKMVHGVATDSDGNRLDEVLVALMRAPRSYTGEDVAEIHGHGGTVNMARLLRAVVAAGARHAEAGEFTRRAFENGRLDLTRAEAVLDVIEASSERAWRLAQAQLDGGLGAAVVRFRAQATELLAEVEACIDFPEEGEEYLSTAAIADKARALGDELAALAATFTLGKAVREGIEVAIAGPVNAGKSSIFNRLIGRDRAIVDPEPGTTRDFVEASVVWDGIPVTLIDTAGERAADSRVEQRGIELGQQRAAQADLILYVHSAQSSVPATRADCIRIDGADGAGAMDSAQRVLHIVSKGDVRQSLSTELLVTSAQTGLGMDELKQAIVAAVCGSVAESDDGHVVTSERQRALFDRAAQLFRRAAAGVVDRAPIEVLAVDIREGSERLAELVGERIGEEVLDDLFSRFCIGK